MGSRASLVIKNIDGYSLYYCHWCADTLPATLFWGPNYAQTFIQQQKPISPDDWLDTIWAEGAVAFDRDEQTLLFYGGEEILFNVPLRRLHLELMHHVWPGWTIRWANQGLVDIADYVGVSRSIVLAHNNQDKCAQTMRVPPEGNRVNIVGSVRFEDNTVWLFPLAALGARVWYFLEYGPNLVQLAEEERTYQSLDLAEWVTNFPRGGFHIDVTNRALYVWQAATFVITEEMERIWSGWHIEHLGDAFERHVILTEGHLQFPAFTSEQLLFQLTDQLLLESNYNPVDVLHRIIEKQQQEGWEVTTSSVVWQHNPLQLTQEIKQEILNDALQAWYKRNSFA